MSPSVRFTREYSYDSLPDFDEPWARKGTHREKQGSYATVFDTAARRKQLEEAGKRNPESLSYRDWFARCSNPAVAIEDAYVGYTRRVVIAWSAAGCPRGPRVRFRVEGARLWISDFGDCL